MHFFGVFCQIHFEAKKHGLRGLPRSELPVAREVIRRDWPTADPAGRAADRAVLRLHAVSGGVLGHHGLHRHRPDQPQSGDRRCLPGALSPWPSGSRSLTEWTGLLADLRCIDRGVGLVRAEGRGRQRRALLDILDAFVVGAKYAIGVGAAAATVGIIIGIVTLTGVGFKLSSIITGAAGDLAALLRRVRAGQLCSTSRR